MPAILALLPPLIAEIPAMTSGAAAVIKFISGIRSAAQQSSEWTPELETAFVNALIAKGSSPAWQPDAAAR